ncbi:Ppx/GppA phosphatase [Desulfuromusa kysingii]|uniref:Ppx/GppA phosphatase n=1 Tax=Desulfuromusa kysingii TaxID=37625 RepID=A0A1H4BNS3_9BACT|nr:hypothetical protein [Desulfuromusa kysingii]SEA49793.1 Ppx/GppA phosphatase [Desulfuromusa kysingii]
MIAVIDVGSNTIRMLLSGSKSEPPQYFRQITRLAGGLTAQGNLSEAGMRRSLETLISYKQVISSLGISCVKAVGTAALRHAKNSDIFVAEVYAATNIKIEIIAGEEEAFLAANGALAVIDPLPDVAVVLDIGGGSTEISCVSDELIHYQQSYPLGVVRLSEESLSAAEREQQIKATFGLFSEDLNQAGLKHKNYQLIGTAGTITTLAAIHLSLLEYNAALINNHVLSVDWLLNIKQKLESMSELQRENLPGMETGRGDLILPGIEILLYLLNQLQLSTLRVSDSGLLEGVMLHLTDS